MRCVRGKDRWFRLQNPRVAIAKKSIVLGEEEIKAEREWFFQTSQSAKEIARQYYAALEWFFLYLDNKTKK